MVVDVVDVGKERGTAPEHPEFPIDPYVEAVKGWQALG